VPIAQPKTAAPGAARLARPGAVIQRAEQSDSKDAYAADHAAIWKWIQGAKNVAPHFKDDGPEMYFVKVGFQDNICHHFAFGNLQGNRQDFDIDALIPAVNELIDRPNDYAKVLPKKLEVMGGQDQAVCLMGTTAPPTDHSARQEVDAGLWWHKFNGLPYVLGFTSAVIFDYKISHFLTVRTAKGGYDAKKVRWRKPA